jgi:hypothetical protein
MARKPKAPKSLPESVMHKSALGTWAELTPMREHKEREARGIVPKIIPPPEGIPEPRGTSKNPLPLTRAKADLRRAYPYIFDCFAYAMTHHPELIQTDPFYSRVTMPYNVFLDYCLDNCEEQTQYLKEELYRLMSGQPAKYIKVSATETVFGQPVIITFKHTEPKTKRQSTIKNIQRDALVDLVQIHILKELITYDNGWLNLPKAFYAKTRRVYNMMNKNLTFLKESEPLTKLEMGGFYKIYLALEYIIANRKKGIKQQVYPFLKLCVKCAPEYTELKNGKLYIHDKHQAHKFLDILCGTVNMLSVKDKTIIGIDSISTGKEANDIVVSFL